MPFQLAATSSQSTLTADEWSAHITCNNLERHQQERILLESVGPVKTLAKAPGRDAEREKKIPNKYQRTAVAPTGTLQGVSQWWRSGFAPVTMA